MCEPGERRELRRLVEHRVAGEQRRHEHVAADEVRIVPGRDVGDDAERVVADALGHAAFVEHRLRRSIVASTSARKKSMRPSSPFDLVARLRAAACRLPASASCASVSSSVATASAKARDRDAPAWRAASPAQAGCAPARAPSAATLGGVVGGHFGERRAVGRVGDLRASSHAVAVAAARRGEKVGEQRRVVERACRRDRWNSGCHCTPAMKLALGRRIASIMPSAGHSAPRRRSPAPRSLTRLVVDAVDRPAASTPVEHLGQPRALHEARP